MRKLFTVIVLVALAIGSWKIWQFYGQKTPQIQYRLARVEQRDLRKSVSATGTLSALITVEVGSEISGQIRELLADYNSPVHKGQVIARISSESHQALVREAEAELALARAKLLTQKAAVERCQADLQNSRANLTAARAQTAKVKATLDNARRELERNTPLLKKGIISRTIHDAAETALAEAKAQAEQIQAQGEAASSQVASSQASLSIARAQVKEAEAQIDLKTATLDKRRDDFDHTIIRSPVDGVIIDRSVDVGQTVAASLSAPTLFTIAQDLSRMQVSAAIDEADIGQIREGQPVRFTVDAFGSRNFEGRVTQIRKAGKTVQNVVTYTVIITVENPDLSLMPGMTADVEIEVLKKPQVLAVANAVLRFKPAGAEAGGVDAAQASINSGAQTDSRSGERGRADPEERIRRLTEALGLNQEQQDSLRTAFQEIGQKMRAARQAGGDSGPMDMGALRDKARKETQNVLMKVLTPEQFQRYERLAGNRQGTRSPKGVIWRLNDKNRPVPSPVILGVGDGSYTEISGTGIEAGTEVIIGTR